MKKLILLLVCMCQIAWTQNLLSNGGFDSNTDGWHEIEGGSVQISWVDSDGNNANGSMELSDNFNNGGVGTINSDRFSVIENSNYTLSAFAKPISSSQAEGATVFIAWFNDDFQVGNSDFYSVSSQQANDTWVKIEEIVTVPQGVKFAEVRLGVDSFNSDSTEDSIVRYDDVRFELFSGDPDAFAMVSGHSALWYDPNQSGHGINLYMLPNQQVLVFWYVYDHSGQPLWLLGLGTHDGFVATLDVSISDGPMFPPQFDPNDVNLVHWGKFELSFSSCNSGLFKWMPIAGNGFDSGEMNLTRLNQTLGLSCQE